MSHPRTSASRPRITLLRPSGVLGPALVLAAMAGPAAPPALGQLPVNPVYVDDSPVAADALSRARSRAASGDRGEAARLLQETLQLEGHRLLPAEEDENLFVSVRRRIHDALLDDPALLERYRDRFGPLAENLFEAGDNERVERDFFLTTAGARATLRLARARLEHAQFDSAWRLLAALERHPDRLVVREEAAALLRTIARYVDHEAPLEIARRFESSDEDAAPIRRPRLNLGRTPLEAAPPVDLTDLVEAPLASAPLPSPPSERGLTEPDRRPPSRARRRDPGSPYYVMPTVAGDVVFVNDGDTVSAWDRFTLDPLWRAPLGEPEEDFNPRNLRRQGVEDTNTVAVYGDWAIAIGGVAWGGQRDRAAEAHALDASSGAVRWTTELARLDESLEEASARGPAVIDQGVIAITLTKQVQQRRLVSATVVGLNLGDGSLEWIRPLGSAGSRPYGRAAKVAEIPIVHRGVLYQTDELGFIAAVEMVTGRPLWVRRIPSAQLAQQNRPPWAGASSVITGDRLYSIAPDGERLLALDVATGQLLAQRTAEDLGTPLYLLRAGDRLVSLGPNGAVALPLAGFEDPSVTPTRIIRTQPSNLVGRAVVAGDRVLLPVDDGLLAARAEAPSDEDVEMLRLEHSGNLVPTPSQLVIVDEEAVHSYLMWEVAQRVLRERIERDPGDPAPAITFAELAYRAGQRDQIVEAVDLALAAIEQAPLEPRHRRLRERLFRSLRDMVAPEGDAAGEPLSRKLLASLIDRMGEAAGASTQRVQHLLVQGRFHEEAGEARQAVASYQTVLDEPALASAQVADDAALVRAGDAATAALRRVVRRWGPEPYAPFASEAARRLEQIGPVVAPEPYVELAERYPVSAAAAQAWLRAAEAYEGRGRPHRAAAALERGLAAAEDALVRDPELLGELAGRLVVLLDQTGRIEAAAEALARVRDDYPTVRLTRRGETLAADDLARRLDAALAARDRRPRLGSIPSDASMQFLARWRLEPPLLDAPAGTTTESVALIGPEGLSLWSVASGGGLERRWTRPGGTDAVLLALTTDAALIVAGEGAATTLERRDLISGDLDWTVAIDDALPDLGPQPQRDEVAAVLAPGDGQRPAEELLVAMDHQTLLLVERSGRAAGVDLQTGRTLWRSASVATGVHDIDAHSGVLTVVGAMQEDEAAAPRPVLATLQSRTGRTIVRTDPQIGALSWVRAGPGGVAVAAGAQGLAAVRLDQEQVLWRLEGPTWRGAADASVSDDHAFVVTRIGEVAYVRLGAGAPAPRRMESRDALPPGQAGRDSVTWSRLAGRTLLAAAGGLLLYDQAGRLVGADHRADDAPLLAPVVAEDRLVTIASTPSAREEDRDRYDVLVFSADSCAMMQRIGVALGAAPLRIGALDNRVLITAGDATVVIDAPADDRRRR